MKTSIQRMAVLCVFLFNLSIIFTFTKSQVSKKARVAGLCCSGLSISIISLFKSGESMVSAPFECLSHQGNQPPLCFLAVCYVTNKGAIGTSRSFAWC